MPRFSMCTTCPAHPILWLAMLDEECRLELSSTFHFLHLPVTSFLVPNILITLLSNTLCLCFSFSHAELSAMPWRSTGGMEVSPHTFLTLVLDVGEWSASWPSHFTSRGRPTPNTHWIGGLVGFRASLREKISQPMLEVEPQSSSP